MKQFAICFLNYIMKAKECKAMLEKIKSLLLTLFIVAASGSILYASVIDPILSGIHKYGLFGFLAMSGYILLIAFLILRHYRS